MRDVSLPKPECTDESVRICRLFLRPRPRLHEHTQPHRVFSKFDQN